MAGFFPISSFCVLPSSFRFGGPSGSERRRREIFVETKPERNSSPVQGRHICHANLKLQSSLDRQQKFSTMTVGHHSHAMKTSFIIRMVAAAVTTTFASLGYLAAVPGSMVLFCVSWLLLVPSGELTRPIPRSERWSTFCVVGGLVAILLALPFIHLHSPSAPSASARFAVAVSLWLVYVWAIFRRWQKEKRKTDA